jgi:hypothetical protein
MKKKAKPTQKPKPGRTAKKRSWRLYAFISEGDPVDLAWFKKDLEHYGAPASIVRVEIREI